MQTENAVTIAEPEDLRRALAEAIGMLFTVNVRDVIPGSPWFQRMDDLCRAVMAYTEANQQRFKPEALAEIREKWEPLRELLDEGQRLRGKGAN